MNRKFAKLGKARPLVSTSDTTASRASLEPRISTTTEPGRTSTHSTSRSLAESLVVHSCKNFVLSEPTTCSKLPSNRMDLVALRDTSDFENCRNEQLSLVATTYSKASQHQFALRQHSSQIPKTYSTHTPEYPTVTVSLRRCCALVVRCDSAGSGASLMHCPAESMRRSGEHESRAIHTCL